ncbi:uncharacterized protein BDV17DRAFT_37814 [Aspergillus undulatus]|uniref:uncharacterized protein n=1 Tax=Aspergillus undulatus TaxID=1810928 RepID=UPI003CCE24C1
MRHQVAGSLAAAGCVESNTGPLPDWEASAKINRNHDGDAVSSILILEGMSMIVSRRVKQRLGRGRRTREERRRFLHGPHQDKSPAPRRSQDQRTTDHSQSRILQPTPHSLTDSDTDAMNSEHPLRLSARLMTHDPFSQESP